jgi:hypothetical protein
MVVIFDFTATEKERTNQWVRDSVSEMHRYFVVGEATL